VGKCNEWSAAGIGFRSTFVCHLYKWHIWRFSFGT